MKKDHKFVEPQRKHTAKRLLVIQSIVCLFILLVYASLQAYAVNTCAEVGLPDGVFSIPTGVSCVLPERYLISMDRIREMMVLDKELSQ